MKPGAGFGPEARLKVAHSTNGESFNVNPEIQTYQVTGSREKEKGSLRNYILLSPEEMVKAQDVLVSVASGEKFTIIEVRPQVHAGRVYALQAFYKTPFEVEQEKNSIASQGITFNIGTAHNSIIGNQQTATIHNAYDFVALDAKIDERGGEDAAGLKAMISEIREMLAENEHVPGGVLARFSAMIERNAWIAEPVSHILLLWGLGRLKVPLA
jgi:hypothetical protein